MKATNLLAGMALMASVGLNIFLWRQLAQTRAESEAVRAAAGDTEALLAENEALKTQSAARPVTSDADIRELARLRNEAGQLRQQITAANAQRAQAAREVEQLRAQVAGASEKMDELKKGSEELLKMSAEQMLVAKERAQSIACVNNLKQIGLAARIYASDHQDTFPANLAMLKQELVTPKVLFCPAAPGGAQAADWTQLNPNTISYQFLNPNGNELDPQKPLAACPFHGNVGYSDGSVQMGKK